VIVPFSAVTHVMRMYVLTCDDVGG